MSSQKSKKEVDYVGIPPKLTELLKTESDRGVILILGAYLEELLGLIIKAIVVTPKMADNLLSHKQTLGDFESRLNIAEAFALIHSEDATALRLIQKLRNKAAHFDRSGRGFDVLFDSPATVDQVFLLCEVVQLGELAPDFTRPEVINTTLLRDWFINSCRKVVTQLMARLLNSTRLESPISSSERKKISRNAVSNSPDGPFFAKLDQLLSQGNKQEAGALVVEFIDSYLERADISQEAKLAYTDLLSRVAHLRKSS